MSRRLLLTIIVAGALLLWSLFALSFLQPVWFEKSVEGVIRYQLQNRLEASLGHQEITRKARELLQQKQEQHAQLLRDITFKKSIDQLIGEMQDPECYCRQVMQDVAPLVIHVSLDKLVHEEAKLKQFLMHEYRNTVEKLLREIRIFTAINALLLSMLATVLFTSAYSAWISLPSITLVSFANLLVAGLYVFQQNWLHAILFGDYLGWGYAFYLLFACIILWDLVFQRARWTIWTLSSLGLTLTAVVAC